MILQLTRELGVNLAGVEIILNMREKMEAMQRQMEGFIDTLNHEFSTRAAAAHRPGGGSNSLVPVIQISSVAGRSDSARAADRKRKAR